MKTKTIILSAIIFACCSVAFSQANEKKVKIKVSTAEEFVKAIGNDRVIELSADTFYLRDLVKLKDLPIDEGGSATLTPYVEYSGGRGIQITNVTGLEITGTTSGTKHSILSSRDYGDAILSIDGCKNIILKDFEANHVPKAEGHCTGGVIYIDGCENILMDNCTLIGSGSYGIDVGRSKNIMVKNTTIKECSTLLSELQQTSDLYFMNCTFTEIRCDGYLIIATDCHSVTYDNCTFSKNYSYNKPGDYEYDEGRQRLLYFYDDKTSANFSFKACNFSDNKILKFTNKDTVVTKTDNKFVNNDGLK
ncbi:MAG: S-layer domain protein [Bacteroidetes bacterium]|jgi:parallel beta-helix repeat protein|nr:S-layer domain protein [Bacteroidota bacterium]